MMVEYNRNFELSIDDVEIIENALKKQISVLSESRKTHIDSTIKPVDELESVKRIDEKIKKINDLLGRIHNQKNWYRPTGQYVSG